MGSTEQKVDRILQALTEWNKQLTGFSTAIQALDKQNKFLNERMIKLQSEIEELKTSKIPLPPRSPVVSPVPAQTLEQLLMTPNKPSQCNALSDSLSDFRLQAKTSKTMPSICVTARENGECDELQEVDGIECKKGCVGAMSDKKEKNYRRARELAITCGYDSKDFKTRF